MTRILHISDLHFGKDRPELVAPLTRAVNRLAPDLVAISGDLTQRARPEQFAAARAFIDGLKPRWLAVPGNHDVPLHNPAMRLFRPFRNYRRAIGRDLEPGYADATVRVQGVNTVDPLAWQRGRFTRAMTARLCQTFGDAADDRVRVLVMHHPLEHLPGQKKRLMLGADRALHALSDCGIHLILSGHLHLWRAEYFTLRTDASAPIQVHAGTGLSVRNRGESNDFNLLDISRSRIDVTRHEARDDAGGFVPAETRHFAAHPPAKPDPGTPGR